MRPRGQLRRLQVAAERYLHNTFHVTTKNSSDLTSYSNANPPKLILSIRIQHSLSKVELSRIISTKYLLNVAYCEALDPVNYFSQG